MKLPSTWPVCIIDDQPEEYRKLFAALNRLGVGYTHVAGDSVRSLPKAPFTRLRLVFLDMHLSGDAISSNTASHTANVFAHVVSPTVAPIVVVVWSKYVKEVDAFRAELYRSKPNFVGKLIFILLEKPLSASKIHVAKLVTAMKSALKPLLPLRLLWGWECLAQLAAVNTSTEVFSLACKRASVSPTDSTEQERAKLLGGLRSVLSALVEAEAGRTASAASAPLDLLHALGATLLDRLDTSEEWKLLEEAGDVLSDSPTPVSVEEQSAMNAMLVYGPVERNGGRFKPGTLYHVTNSRAFARKVGVSEDEFWREFSMKSVHQNTEKFADWKRVCKLVAVEISASCDYAQNKRATSRILVGLLVPDANKSGAQVYQDSRKQDSRCTVARYNLVDADGTSAIVLPIFCSQFVFTPAWKRPPTYMKPIGRIRERAVTDIRNWCFAQAARVGFLYSSEVKAAVQSPK